MVDGWGGDFVVMERMGTLFVKGARVVADENGVNATCNNLDSKKILTKGQFEIMSYQ